MISVSEAIWRLQRVSFSHQRIAATLLHGEFNPSIDPALVAGGPLKNISLVKVNIGVCAPGHVLQEIKFLGHRNRFAPLLTYASPPLGIWSRALAKVATEPAVLFHVLGNKPQLVVSAGMTTSREKFIFGQSR
jgi:hypothetical protein